MVKIRFFLFHERLLLIQILSHGYQKKLRSRYVLHFSAANTTTEIRIEYHIRFYNIKIKILLPFQLPWRSSNYQHFHLGLVLFSFFVIVLYIPGVQVTLEFSIFGI